MSRKSVADIEDWAIHTPEAQTRDWDMLAGSFIRSAANLNGSFASVHHARLKTNIASKDWTVAGPGAVHYFSVNPYDYAVIDLDGGGTRCLGTGTKLDYSIGKHLGIVSLKAIPHMYLGW